MSLLAEESNHQIVEVLSFCDRERTQVPSIRITALTFLVKKKFNEDFRSVYYSVLLTCEPASFWRQNVIAVVISTTSFSENVVVAETSYQM